MSTISDLIIFGWVMALCILLCSPVRAEGLNDFLNDGSVEMGASGKTSGGLGALFGLKTVEGGRSNIGSPRIAPDINVVHDFSYGTLPDQKMDIYTKGKLSGAPVILMVHGGGWRNGGKDVSKTVDNKVARWVPAGFVFISINYPMLPDTDVEAQAENVAKAIATAQQYADQWGGDATKFILMGHSAGAHLVSLINANPEVAYAQGARPWLGVVSLDSGAMNIVELMSKRHTSLYDDAFGGDEEQWKSLSPFYQMSAKARPWMNVCSTKRDTSCSQSRAMADRAAGLGVKAALLQQNLTHAEINGNLGLPGTYTAGVEEFMASLDPAVAATLSHASLQVVPEPSQGRTGLLKRLRERRAVRDNNR